MRYNLATQESFESKKVSSFKNSFDVCDVGLESKFEPTLIPSSDKVVVCWDVVVVSTSKSTLTLCSDNCVEVCDVVEVVLIESLSTYSNCLLKKCNLFQ